MSPPLHKKIFYVLILILPLNLGKHILFNWSYVDGLLIDYLIPTIYIQDVLILGLLILWLLEIIKLRKSLLFPLRSSFIPLLIFYLYCVLLSSFSALRILPALYLFLKLFLYALLSFYILNEFSFKKDFRIIATLLSISVFCLSILGVAQWFQQSSVFNNYLFFGEQPYTSSTPGIAVKNFFDIAKVPAYGTFRHPNVLGGFLSIVLLWILKKKSLFSYLVFFLGFVTLLLTLSKTAILTFLLGLIFTFLLKRHIKGIKTLLVLFSLLVIVGGLLFSTIPEIFTSDFFTKNPSVYRRANFILSSIEAIKRRPLFGIGLNNSTVLIERFLPPIRDIRFAQPVHNILILTFAESGFFAFTFLLIFLSLLIKKLLSLRTAPSNLVVVSLLQLLFLGSFDHYVFTIHQTLLLFWIVVGLGLCVCIKDIDTTPEI